MILYSASKDKTINVWDMDIYNLIATLEGHEDWVTSLTFNNDETTLFSSSYDGKIILWDLETNTKINTLQ